MKPHSAMKKSANHEIDIVNANTVDKLININITKTNTRLHNHLKFALHHCKEWWCHHFNKINLLQYIETLRVTQTCFPNDNRYIPYIASSLPRSIPSHSAEAEVTRRCWKWSEPMHDPSSKVEAHVFKSTLMSPPWPLSTKFKTHIV